MPRRRSRLSLRNLFFWRQSCRVSCCANPTKRVVPQGKPMHNVYFFRGTLAKSAQKNQKFQPKKIVHAGHWPSPYGTRWTVPGGQKSHSKKSGKGVSYRPPTQPVTDHLPGTPLPWKKWLIYARPPAHNKGHAHLQSPSCLFEAFWIFLGFPNFPEKRLVITPDSKKGSQVHWK